MATQPLKAKPDVRDILTLAQHSNADRVHADDRRTYDVQDDLDVVDHQIENNTDIGASVRIRREASDFEKPWVIEFAFQRGEDWVETLDVSDLEHTRTACSKLGKRAGIGRRVGDGLFHEKVLAAFQEKSADLVVGDGVGVQIVAASTSPANSSREPAACVRYFFAA